MLSELKGIEWWGGLSEPKEIEFSFGLAEFGPWNRWFQSLESLNSAIGVGEFSISNR